MSDTSLSAALADVGDPPCSTCSLRQVCRATEVACDDFARWCHTGKAAGECAEKPRRPTRAVWMRLYADGAP